MTPTPIPVSTSDIPAWDVILRYLVAVIVPIITVWLTSRSDRKKAAENGKSAAAPVPTQPLPIKEQAETVGNYAETLSTMADNYQKLDANYQKLHERQNELYNELSRVKAESYKQNEQLRSDFEMEKRRMLARNAALDKRVRYLHNGVDILIMQLKGHNIPPAWANGQKFDMNSGGDENGDV